MRYGVIDGSEHQCCFMSSVVDMTKPVIINGRDFGFETVCECYDRPLAQEIADALTSQEETDVPQ